MGEALGFSHRLASGGPAFRRGARKVPSAFLDPFLAESSLEGDNPPGLTSIQHVGGTLGLCLLLFLGSCKRRFPDPYSEESELHLVRIEPLSDLVFLNQKLIFVFDKPLDPELVTDDTLRILDSHGVPVPGKRMVRGNTVEFIPSPPLDPGLRDGSFKPGERYRLWMAHYPMPIAIRGERGELLIKVPKKSWKAVGPDDLPEGYASPLLPSSSAGPFVLLPPPDYALQEGEPVLRLRFNHSLYPPSVRPGAFRILWRSGLVREIPIAKTRILPQAGPGGFGSIVEISPLWDLEPGLYRLFLLPGIRGVLDDRLQSLKIWEIQTGTGLPKLKDLSRDGAWVDFLVDRRVPPRISHDFSVPRPCLKSLEELRGTGWDPDGTLQWGPGGLFAPDLGFRDFQSLGDLEVHKVLALKGGEKLPGTQQVLPKGGKPWDFDRLVLGPKGKLVLHLDPGHPTVLRVAGRVDLQGEVQVIYPGESPPPRLGGKSLVVGDPRPSWPPKGGQLRWLVGGWLKAQGTMTVENAAEGSPRRPLPEGCLGFFWARGPVEVNKAFRSRLQVWVRPSPAEPPQGAAHPLRLSGSWVGVSPWLAIPRAVPGSSPSKASKKLLKGILVGIPMERRDLSFLLQLRGEGGAPREWRPSGGLTVSGDARYVRIAILWNGGLVTSRPLVRALGVR